MTNAVNLDAVMTQLKQVGTAQNRKVYRRHGAGDNLYGVSFADLHKLERQLKSDHALARQLWETGNADARCLALLIADPHLLTARQADQWCRAISYYLLADMLGGLVARAPYAIDKFRKWSVSPQEFVKRCGYTVLCCRLRDAPDSVTDDLCRACLQSIPQDIHQSPNYARHAMNGLIISVGIYKPALREAALATAHRVGKVEVDHGQTNCKTPDAAAYIQKAVDRPVKTTSRKKKKK